MITTSVRGHLASFDFPPNYGWNKCDPIELFDAPIEASYRGDMEGIERMLRQLAGQCRVLILWLDCDREGEAIGDEVRQVCLRGNPRLRILRARFSTVLAPEIKRALQSLGMLNENFVAAVQARSELDLRVGAAFTRFQTLRLKQKFDGFNEQGVVSYGPCQFPTLGFVVERWARIETFIPNDFWYLELTLRLDNVNNDGSSTLPPRNNLGRPIHFTWQRTRLYDRLATLVLYESCLEARMATVIQLQGRPKNKWRPVPLATVELQKRASRFLRIGSETLMTAAEELYQQGYISYPRTETEKFRPEFHHFPLIEQLSTINGDVGQYAAKLLTNNNFQMPRAGQHDDQAHPPITPCRAVDPETITDMNQRNVYILVVKHYLACCSRDAVGKETQLTLRMATEEFTAKGLMVLEKNWLEIYHPWERWSTGEGELPPLQVGSQVEPASLLMKEGRTTPPEPISEVELISLMDRNGIGTDATIAQHISTIQDREYAIKDASQKFLPTKLGIALVEGYNSMGYQLNKPDLRRETEAECNLVSVGRKQKGVVVAELLAKMRQCFVTARQEAHKLDEAVARHYNRLGSSNDTTEIAQAQFSECGTCNQMMALKQDRAPPGRNGHRRKLLYCSICRSGLILPRGNVAPHTDVERGGSPVKCPICSYQVIKILRGDGYEGNGYHVCPKCFSHPPVEHGGTTNSGQFRCFSCQHPTCSLANGTPGGDAEAFTCPTCHPGGVTSRGSSQSKVTARKTSRGFVLSCNKYIPGQNRCSYTIWLPKACEAVNVLVGDENEDSLCPSCSTPRNIVRKIKFSWKRGSVPPHYGDTTIVCILCDEQFRREMEISLPQPNQVVARPVPGQGGRGRGLGGTRTAGRGRGRAAVDTNVQSNVVCYRCGQPGHFASSCPNR